MPKIQNIDQLAVSPGRKSLLAIAEAGLQAIDTATVIRETVQRDGNSLRIGDQAVDLGTVQRLIFIAIGKCAADAALAASHIIGDRIVGGVVVDVKPCPPIGSMKTFCGTHPLPSAENLRAAEAIRTVLTGLGENDLVLFLVSGGGSTLLFLPEDRTDQSEIRIVTALINAGATIQEMNTIRKHLSLARGGYLAQYAYPARVISLILSDVPANDIAFIASGPTVKDATTIQDAERVLAKYDILKLCNLEKCGLIETPKDEKYFERVTNILAVSNVRALEAMKKAAEALGFSAEIRDTQLTGEADDIGVKIWRDIDAVPSKTVLLWGGETTVTVRGKGSGGRNLEVSLSALRSVGDGEEIFSLASDGRDHGAFAGALCDTITKKAVEKSGLDIEQCLRENNTYPFFEQVGNYVMTGDTGSNVSDLIIALKE